LGHRHVRRLKDDEGHAQTKAGRTQGNDGGQKIFRLNRNHGGNDDKNK